MTREQKIEWLANADNEKLLKQYEQCSYRAYNAFEIAAKDDRFTIEGIFEDLELTKAEVLRRMAK